jgi:hypothetical protein
MKGHGMFRRTDLIMIAAMIGVVTYTYTVKNNTKHSAAELAKLQRQVAAELNAIDVLHADWSVLTSPARIQDLVAVHSGQLGLEPLQPKRFVALSDIPMRPEPAPVADIDDILARFGDGTDGLTTGSVGAPVFENDPGPSDAAPVQGSE